jgi:hypothetical protein
MSAAPVPDLLLPAGYIPIPAAVQNERAGSFRRLIGGHGHLTSQLAAAAPFD